MRLQEAAASPAGAVRSQEEEEEMRIIWHAPTPHHAAEPAQVLIQNWHLFNCPSRTTSYSSTIHTAGSQTYGRVSSVALILPATANGHEGE